MKLHCPHCGVKGSAEDSYSGRTVKCPKCHGVFEVKPDTAPLFHEDDTSLAALTSPPTESPAPLDEVEIPLTDERGLEATEGDEILPAAELKESAQADGELADAAIENPPLAEEEELNWEDIASEIDLHSAEHDSEEDLEGDPAGLSSLQDDFEKPAGEFDPTSEDEDNDIDDIEEEFGDDIWAEEEEEPAEIEATGFAEESPLLDPVDSVTAEQEIADELVETFESDEIEEREEVEEVEEFPDVDGVELEPYGLDKEQCWQCGKENSDGEKPFTVKDDRLYCADCILIEQMTEIDAPHKEFDRDDNFDAQRLEDDGFAESTVDSASAAFSIGGAIRQAWAKIKGAKGSIWAGSAIMYLVLLVLVVGGALLLPSPNGDTVNMSSLLISLLLQVLTNVFSVIFGAGLLFMGIRKAAGDRISWTMIFQGFSCAWKIIVATILQSIFVAIGFLLLVLPGIYLLVGYAMTIPLIIDKGMAPWQAMEMSRKAIHKVWWKVAGLFIVMGIIFGVTAFPPLVGVSLALPIFFTMSWQMLLGLGAFALLGIGLIWTWPMFILLGGVIYKYLFGGDKEIS